MLIGVVEQVEEVVEFDPAEIERMSADGHRELIEFFGLDNSRHHNTLRKSLSQW